MRMQRMLVEALVIVTAICIGVAAAFGVIMWLGDRPEAEAEAPQFAQPVRLLQQAESVTVTLKPKQELSIPIEFVAPPGGLSGYTLEVRAYGDVMVLSATQFQSVGLLKRTVSLPDSGGLRLSAADLVDRWNPNEGVNLATIRLVAGGAGGSISVDVVRLDDDAGEAVAPPAQLIVWVKVAP